MCPSGLRTIAECNPIAYGTIGLPFLGGCACVRELHTTNLPEWRNSTAMMDTCWTREECDNLWMNKKKSLMLSSTGFRRMRGWKHSITTIAWLKPGNHSYWIIFDDRDIYARAIRSFDHRRQLRQLGACKDSSFQKQVLYTAVGMDLPQYLSLKLLFPS